jgi:hypothetical protein
VVMTASNPSLFAFRLLRAAARGPSGGV